MEEDLGILSRGCLLRRSEEAWEYADDPIVYGGAEDGCKDPSVLLRIISRAT